MKYQNTEPKKVLYTLLTVIGECQQDIDSLKDWSLFDLLGGRYFMSTVKRKKITECNQKLESLNQIIKKTQEVVTDSHFDTIALIPNSKNDRFLDIWGDNVFTDWKVRKEIRVISEQVSQLKAEVRDLLDSLA